MSDKWSPNSWRNKNALHIDSSVNLFSQTDYVAEQSSRGDGIVIPNSNDNPSRWVIQAKFETPMFRAPCECSQRTQNAVFT